MAITLRTTADRSERPLSFSAEAGERGQREQASLNAVTGGTPLEAGMASRPHFPAEKQRAHAKEQRADDSCWSTLDIIGVKKKCMIPRPRDQKSSGLLASLTVLLCMV